MGYSGMQSAAPTASWPISENDAHELRKAWAKETDLRARIAGLAMEQHRLFHEMDLLCCEADLACRAREGICLHIEKEYDLPPGSKWTIDNEEAIVRVA
jgi:hypothetical protein